MNQEISLKKIIVISVVAIFAICLVIAWLWGQKVGYQKGVNRLMEFDSTYQQYLDEDNNIQLPEGSNPVKNDGNPSPLFEPNNQANIPSTNTPPNNNEPIIPKPYFEQ